MTVKLEAAFHEAGHAVAARHSRFHALAGPISLYQYGEGEIFIGLNPQKCVNQGKVPSLDLVRDPEVAKDLAVVLVAGLAAEKIAAANDSALSVNRTCAEPDLALLRQQLAGAGLSLKFDRHEDDATSLLQSQWGVVHQVAMALFEAKTMTLADLRALFERIERVV